MKKIILNFVVSDKDTIYQLIPHIRIGENNAELCINMMFMNNDVLDFSVLEVA